jgi:hypothetical protein
MANISLRAKLATIGEISSSFSFPNSFQTAPNSLRTFIEAMDSPRIENWRYLHKKEFANTGWSEEFQGLSHDSNCWYFSNKSTVIKFNLQMQKLSETGIPHEFASRGYNHYGDCDFYNGNLYIPLEDLSKNLTPLILVFDSNLNLVRFGKLSPQIDAPWCAVHPWNKQLYSCPDTGVISVLNAYDLATFNLTSQIKIYDPNGNPESLRSIAGGCFSPRGRLYLTSNHSEDIRCYSMLNGKILGRKKISYSKGFSEYEEMEGLTIWDLRTRGDGNIHIAILDNDYPSQDDLFLYHFESDDPQLI